MKPVIIEGSESLPSKLQDFLKQLRILCAIDVLQKPTLLCTVHIKVSRVLCNSINTLYIKEIITLQLVMALFIKEIITLQFVDIVCQVFIK